MFFLGGKTGLVNIKSSFVWKIVPLCLMWAIWRGGTIELLMDTQLFRELCMSHFGWKSKCGGNAQECHARCTC
jgi:hypothetical protein